jgi:hypothetical protein
LLPIDSGRTITITSSLSSTLTIPLALPQGFTCNMIQLGSASIFITGSTGVTIFNRLNHRRTAGIYSIASINFVSGNAYLFTGETTS